MSALFKCILGICVVLCFLRLIDMARIARDDAAVKNSVADLIYSFNNLISFVMDKLKTAVYNGQVRKLFDDAGKVIGDAAKAAQSKFGDLCQNAEKTPDKN